MIQPSPEEAQEATGQAFNLGALTAAQVVRLNRALSLEFFYEGEQPTQDDEQPDETLLEALRGAIAGLAATDLDRAKEIVVALKNDDFQVSGDPYGPSTAADCAPSFVAYDYEFARDTLLGVMYGDEPNEGAILAWRGIQGLLTPVQLADFQQHDRQHEQRRLAHGQ